MTFQDIKVGDTVFIQKAVSYAWHRAKYFWVPIKVIKVTPTQFICEGDLRCKKDGGALIGTGQGIRKFVRLKMPDETHLMQEFSAKLSAIRHLKQVAEKVTSLDVEKLLDVKGIDWKSAEAISSLSLILKKED